ncbi:hypothetical protein [Antarcticirhabdus aurantiaca]|uniref:Uncharacterized protein n=1 Tax=Antarcticirhabdus aurantiaca TaxID=2606717 RepID=A0ACD4NRE7_9HYPH|nr:hypothetical protein OXU80_03660 [Jeongeuplla avenae]
MAGFITHLGYLLYQPASSFAAPSYVHFRWVDEEKLGLAMMLYGAARFVALIVNGKMGLEASARVRALISLGSFLLMVAWAWGIQKSGTASTGLVAYQYFALFELMNIFQARADAHAYREKQKRQENQGGGTSSPGGVD